jgi:hypothetical protein
LTSVRARADAGPSTEGAGKRSNIGVAHFESNFIEGKTACSQHLLGGLLPGATDEISHAGILLCKSPLEGAPI